ncbi:single-stranded-DNA-specific exonuclease RecJ [bacterium]|nr:single-stranded-DNA-specific exonuclease RecJ [bacterium]
MYKKWLINDSNTKSQKSLIERLLDNRFLFSAKKREDFLNPLKMNFTSPYAFKDMQKSVERIVNAIETQEKIVIWGDFDADGVTSTCLLFKTLEHLGANVEYYIPSRHIENHGLNSNAIVKFLTKKVKLFITVDCASNDEKEISLIKSFNADVIVTDHHDVEKKIPQLYALINPKAKDNIDENLSIEEIEYLTYLAGVGVAFKLALALLEHYNKKDFVNELLPLVALGTVADVVPLLGENRAFVKMGLELIQNGKNKGITELLKSINYNYEITSECIAFYIAPRINAASRLDTAQNAFNLLYETDESKLKEYAQFLNEKNEERQKFCDEIFEEAELMIANDENFAQSSSIVLYNSNWHVGIIGIVASKLVEQYYKPVFLMTDKDDLIACSARGIEETDIYEIIKSIKDKLTGGGGHKMAGGFAFSPQNIPFEHIKNEIENVCSEMLEGIELIPQMQIDLEVEPQQITLDFLNELKQLEPFGALNPEPLFCTKNLRICGARLMGQNSNHLKLQCKGNNSNIIDCVFWNKDYIPKAKDELIDLVFYPKINEFNGDIKVQFDVKDMQYEEFEKVKFIDQRGKENIEELLEDYCKNNSENIKIYAYKKESLEKLEKYPNLSRNILTKVLKTPQLVFYDYPKSIEKLRIIIEKVEPEIIHIIKNKVQYFTVDNYIKTFCGLLKYVFNQKDGMLNYSDLSNYFTYDEKLIKQSINFLQNANMLEIEEDKILKMNVLELSSLQKNDGYEDLSINLNENNLFLNKLENASVDEIAKMLS